MKESIGVPKSNNGYEEEMARLELQGLNAGVQRRRGRTIIRYESTEHRQTLEEQSAFWERIDTNEGDMCRQAQAEQAQGRALNGTAWKNLMTEEEREEGGKRHRRYGVHALHEYRGRYTPQLARGMMNMAGIPEGGMVADPMCGSGTTIVEAVLSGRNAVGMDANPLAAWMSQVKVQALQCEPAAMEGHHGRLTKSLENAQEGAWERWATELGEDDSKYLLQWFDGRVLEEMAAIREVVYRKRDKRVRDVLLLALSNIVREVSWQKTDDLRTRRTTKTRGRAGETRKRYLREAAIALRTVTAGNAATHRLNRGNAKLGLGDARKAGEVWAEWDGAVDAVITSPPYASALPYIDTDRLNLIVVGLAGRRTHRTLEQRQIGNREVGTSDLHAAWTRYTNEGGSLPEGTRALIEEIEERNRKSDAGCRRKAMAGVLAEYFLDMREVIRGVGDLVRSGGSLCMVVGNNTTTAGGRRINIQTARQLQEIAAMEGWTTVRVIETHPPRSREAFRRNQIQSEKVVWMTR